MDWLTEGTTYDVVQEWKKRYPQYSIMEFDDYSKITTPDMKLVLSGEKTISDVLDSIEEKKKNNKEKKKKTKKMGDNDSPSESKKKTIDLVLCYQCFIRLGGDSEKWDSTECDTTTRRTCQKCGITGLYVRRSSEEEKQPGTTDEDKDVEEVKEVIKPRKFRRL